jgi:hypothetical protein
MPLPDSFKPTGPIKQVDPKVLKNIVLQDDSIIIAAAKAYVEADVHVNPALITYAVTKREGVFAKVNVAVKDEGGYFAYLKKVNNIWVVIVTGQDLPGKATAEKYGLPQGWFTTEF